VNPLLPDRRLAPRPLPAHLASAAWLWLSSRGALPFLNSVLPRSSKAGERLRALAAEIAASGFEPVAAAVDVEIGRRAEAYVAGLEAYRRHPYRRADSPAQMIWREGTTRVIDYGLDPAAPVVLVVPSLINRYYVLDLLPEHAFVRHLAGRGLRPLVVDWGSPGASEPALDLALCVDRLERALTAVAPLAARPPAVVGYCMGGLLALALTLRPRQPSLAALALLATPWNFHAERAAHARLLGLFGQSLAKGGTGTLPVDVIQSLFFWLDPFLAQRKFARFAALDPASAEARRFVALEDWINDGVPLPLGLARECLSSWYGENSPARGLWWIGDRVVRPQRLRVPTLVVVPSRDRIVPPASALALAAAIPDAELWRPPLGHIGMMSAARAPELLWTPLARWLSARSAGG
jgi:polyhydroxyalkanoate synthase subunit PhaC